MKKIHKLDSQIKENQIKTSDILFVCVCFLVSPPLTCGIVYKEWKIKRVDHYQNCKTNKKVTIMSCTKCKQKHYRTTKLKDRKGNGELLELRLLETGFLSRFQLNP